MKKILVAIIAIIDGLFLVGATLMVILGIIYATTINAEYLLLLLGPFPIAWIHKKLNNICDRLDGGKNE